MRMEAACNTQNRVKLIFVNEIQLLQANNYPLKVTFLLSQGFKYYFFLYGSWIYQKFVDVLVEMSVA